MNTMQVRYRRGSACSRDLQDELDAIVLEMGHAPNVPTRLAVEEGSYGADPMLTTIIITVVTHAATRIFDEVILPRLKDRLADDALGPPLPPEDE